MRVVHVGVVGDLPGGMAQVLAGYLSWNYEVCSVTSIRSTRGRRDPLAPLLWILAAAKIVATRISHGRIVTIIHMSQGGAFVREGSLAWLSRSLGMAVGIHIHGSSFPDFANRRPKLVQVVLNAAITVFTLTDETSVAVSKYARATSVILKVPNAVNIPTRWPAKERLIVFAGEVGHRKGCDVLLAAWRRLAEKRNGWRLAIAGPLKMDLSPYSDISDIEFLGPLPHDEVTTLLSSASMAVLPSRNEALPMFLLESMAQKCAVIGTRVGSIAELLEGAGEVIEPNSVEQLTATMRDLMESDTMRDQLSKRAFDKIVRYYSAESCARTLENEWLRMQSKISTKGAVKK